MQLEAEMRIGAKMRSQARAMRDREDAAFASLMDGSEGQRPN